MRNMNILSSMRYKCRHNPVASGYGNLEIDTYLVVITY